MSIGEGLFARPWIAIRGCSTEDNVCPLSSNHSLPRIPQGWVEHRELFSTEPRILRTQKTKDRKESVYRGSRNGSLVTFSVIPLATVQSHDCSGGWEIIASSIEEKKRRF